ncbi:hypothetical protein EJ06DRAFT_548829 [Trichodelitschia bisporula]|uniref:INO80 complex subunit F domain-containing protein n=1 Tax=Trichodelitschia bisporula TaxID=703511 RepID=A0A6G1HY26_9PEZI|nr:hypothetical protein EJ06DRAFT_548829 [Trichodelitschia bisporula]
MPQSTSHAARIQHGVSANSPLPPSVEAAYYRKCIELKRRITEIEDNNDQLRVRKLRINRGILKLRLERAMLLERIEALMQPNVDESDRSTSPPATPQDKPLRAKRGHRSKGTPPPAGAQPSPSEPTSYPPANATPASATSRFFNTYQQSPLVSTPTVVPATTTTANGTPAQGSASRSGRPSASRYDTYDESHENGDDSNQAAQESEESAEGRGEMNGGDRDTEMSDAGSPSRQGSGFGGGFASVNG